jgi:hypothetical protein
MKTMPGLAIWGACLCFSAVLSSAWAQAPRSAGAVATLPLAPGTGRARILVNWDEENLWAPFFATRTPPVSDAVTAKGIIEEAIDGHAAAGVDTVSLCFFGAGFKGCVRGSKVAECLENQTVSGIHFVLRPPALDEAGIDYLRVAMERCHSRGMRFLAGLRMNDRHGFPPDRFADGHPEWSLNLSGGGFDYSYEPVRQQVLDFVAEILASYEVDGIEFDTMRWCHMFPPGEGSNRATLLTDFMVKTRKLLDQAAAVRGKERLELGVRVPQTLDECRYLGFEVGAWMKQSLIDYVSPSDFFFTDVNARTEDFVKLAEGTACKVYPALQPQVGWGTGPLLTVANCRAAARNFYAYGAAGVSAYNYQDFWACKPSSVRVPVSFATAMGYLKDLQDPKQVAAGERQYFFYSLWYPPRASETGAYHDDSIYLTRGEQPSGHRRFRTAEDFADPGLRTTLRLKALELAGTEDLQIGINGVAVPAEYITRVPVADGKSPSGRGFPAYVQYTLDMNWTAQKQALVNGDNELEIKLLQKDNAGPQAGRVTIDELEVLIRQE